MVEGNILYIIDIEFYIPGNLRQGEKLNSIFLIGKYKGIKISYQD